MKIILATDSFKGCLSSGEVENTISTSCPDRDTEFVSIPMSDGGEGMLQAFISALHGRIIETTVHDPLMRPVTAAYGITPDGTAIIESAQACGLTLMSPEERNPMTATTYGVGELITDAIHNNCRNFIIGLGGSGTSDSGKGMLKAITDSFPSEMPHCRFTIASDVRNPLFGPQGAAYTFAPQKGATPEMVKELDRRAQLFAEESARIMHKDTSMLPGAGAAGGLGYAFMQYFNATFRSGADLLLDLINFDSLITGADLVITGEGHADSQTLMGKLPERILHRTLPHHIPVWLIAGRVSQSEALISAGFAEVHSITPDSMPTEEAIKPEIAKENIRRWVKRRLG